MNIENAKSQMRKGMLEYCVLLLLEHRPSYENDGLLQYEWQESTQGPPRKYYALSKEGEKFLEGLDAAWTELSNTINYLKNVTPKLLESK